MNLNDTKFRNNFVDHFHGDENLNHKSRMTPNCFYSLVHPSQSSSPTLLAWARDLAEQFNISEPNDLSLNILSGNFVTPSMKPYASCYGGHQFGLWAGQLGDGRALTLGEIEKTDGSFWELQLKGAGQTPYSRRADGRAVLRSSLREFIMSEAMAHLGVPTTRALSLIKTEEAIPRDMLYDGNLRFEPGAIVARMSPSFLRFGHFEILFARQEIENLKSLLAWVMKHLFENSVKCDGPEDLNDDNILQWFSEVCRRTAFVISEWMRVGFVHGVMNTDNMSILGLTIDYGPFGMMDNFDPQFTPNTTDLPGRRYCFAQQPQIGLWNLERLAHVLSPLLKEPKRLSYGLDVYQNSYIEYHKKFMSEKLGLDEFCSFRKDESLFRDLDHMLQSLHMDMTLFYNSLSTVVKTRFSRQSSSAGVSAGPLAPEDWARIVNEISTSSYQQLNSEMQHSLFSWLKMYNGRLDLSDLEDRSALAKMTRANPKVVARNYLLQTAIDKLEEGDSTYLEELYQALKQPYQNTQIKFQRKRPDWALNKPGCSMLSCSS